MTRIFAVMFDQRVQARAVWAEKAAQSFERLRIERVRGGCPDCGQRCCAGLSVRA